MRDEKEFSCCFTGYRPQKFPFLLKAGSKEYTEFENNLMKESLELADNGCNTFITGMAMGFDIIAAECVLLLKAMPKFSGGKVKLVCALPFKDQAKKYPAEWQERYNAILKRADETVIISNDYYPGCYFDRNRFMVDNSDCVVTWFDGGAGGTKNTIDYAKAKARKVININTEYAND